jgi:hypothetical protein
MDGPRAQGWPSADALEVEAQQHSAKGQAAAFDEQHDEVSEVVVVVVVALEQVVVLTVTETVVAQAVAEELGLC